MRLREALPARHRVAATIAAGCGLRQGGVFGPAVDDVEFLGRTLHVVRQVKIVRSRLVFALPKGRKTRDIPLPETVATELAKHIAAFPPLEVTLSGRGPTASRRPFRCCCTAESARRWTAATSTATRGRPR